MADTPHEALVRKGYAAFSAADMATLTEVMAPDVVHRLPGQHQLAGEHKGRDAVFAFYGRTGELTGGTFSVELESVHQEDSGQVTARHRARGSREGRTLDDRSTILFTVADGQAVYLDETPDDQDAHEAFWA